MARDGDTVVKQRELSGGEAETTNNRMELLAAITALETLSKGAAVTVVTDSSYVKDGITKWIHSWKKSDWKKGKVKNIDLWQRLDAAEARHDVTWEWVKGHAGHPENEKADELARAGMAPFKKCASPTFRTILPICALLSMRAWAAAASASGNS